MSFQIENGVLKKYTGNDAVVPVPDGVTNIMEGAFEYCNIIESVYVPDSVVGIGTGAFSGCHSLRSVRIPAGVNMLEIGLFEDCIALEKILLLGKIDEIEMYAFSGCKSLRHIIAPETPTELFKKRKVLEQAIMGYLNNKSLFTNNAIAAEYVKYLSTRKKQLLPLIIKDDLVETITAYAESGRITKENIDTEFLTPAIEAKAANCISYLLDWKNKNVTAEDIDKQFEKELNKDIYNKEDMKKLWSFKKSDDGTLIMTKYKGNEDDISVPPRIDKTPVTKIEEKAFQKNKTLEKITIPDSVTEIGFGAFKECKALKEIHLPNSITKINSNTFENCFSLVQVNIPDSVTEICGGRVDGRTGAFKGCKSLVQITIPDGVTKIGANAFNGCKSLLQIHIGNSFTKIGSNAFEGCKKLVDKKGFIVISGILIRYLGSDVQLQIPNSITAIGSYAFSGCTAITQITIPDSLTTIGSSAFEYCTALTQITIPDSVTKIGDWAFYGCTALTQINIPDSVTKIGAEAFRDCESLKIITPNGSYAERYAKKNGIAVENR